MSNCAWWKDDINDIFHAFFSALRLSAGIHPLDNTPALFSVCVSSMSNSVKMFGWRASLLEDIQHNTCQNTNTCTLRTRSDESPQWHVQMCKHDMLVSRYVYCIYMHIHTYTNTHKLTQTQMRSHRQTHSLSRESACEFRDTGEEKCKCSSLQVSDMASVGRWMRVWEKEGDSERERFRERWCRFTVYSLCLPLPRRSSLWKNMLVRQRK